MIKPQSRPSTTSIYVTADPSVPSDKNRCIILQSDYSFIGNGKNITLEQNQWPSHRVTTQTAAFILGEVLGFEVLIKEVRLEKGDVDANLEAWEFFWLEHRKGTGPIE